MFLIEWIRWVLGIDQVCYHNHRAAKKQRVVMKSTGFGDVADTGWRDYIQCRVCKTVLKEDFRHTGAIQGMGMASSDNRIFKERGWVSYDCLYSITKRTYS